MHEQYRHYLYSSTASYGVSPTFILGSDFNTRQGFCSVYAVTKETAQALQSSGTTKGFKGVVWSERLWLDFDSYEAAERAEVKLREMGYDFIAYDTGGRGAHFGVARIASPSHLLPALDRAWATIHFPEADKCIYTHLHPFRLPGTTHSSTGRQKRLVCEQRGSSISLPPASSLEMHLTPTPERKQGGSKSIFDCYRVMANTVPVERGERHLFLVRMVYALKDEAQVDADIAIWWTNEWSKLLSDPKSEEEIEKVVKSIYG